MRRQFLRVLGLAFGLLALLGMPEVAAAGGVTLAYEVITNTQVNAIWRKVQGALQNGFNFVTPEFRWISNRFPELNIDASLREMTFPVDLFEDRGVASVPEGGRLAEPMSVNAEDATIVFVNANKRFTASRLQRWASQADGGRGYIVRQLTFQGRKAVEAIGRNLGDQFYGFSNGVLAINQTVTSANNATYTLNDAYGDTDIPGTDTASAKYIANLFKIGDRVALVRSGALVPNGVFGEVTDVDAATPSITVTWGTAPSAQVGDQFVLSNSTDGTTLEHTSFNHNLVGLLEMLKSASVHGIDNSTVPNWDVALADTVAGRFTGIKWRRAVDEIHNFGDADANIVTLYDQGVYRDTMSQYQAGVRFPSMMALEIDGDFTARGNTPLQSRRMPPGHVCLYGRQAIKTKNIFDNTDGGFGYTGSQAKWLTNDSGWVFDTDWAGLMAVTSRKQLAYFTGQERA